MPNDITNEMESIYVRRTTHNARTDIMHSGALSAMAGSLPKSISLTCRLGALSTQPISAALLVKMAVMTVEFYRYNTKCQIRAGCFSCKTTYEGGAVKLAVKLSQILGDG